jgi:hypothetical protein
MLEVEAGVVLRRISAISAYPELVEEFVKTGVSGVLARGSQLASRDLEVHQQRP